MKGCLNSMSVYKRIRELPLAIVSTKISFDIWSKVHTPIVYKIRWECSYLTIQNGINYINIFNLFNLEDEDE